MYKVKLLNKIAEAGTEYLVSNGCEVGPDISNPDAILVRSAKMHDYAFNPELLCIARAGSGTNNIPIDRCLGEGIAVFNTPGANAEAVKELAICALLMSSRDIEGGIQWVRSIAGEGDKIPNMVEKGKSAFAGPEIAGKTLGVIGLGAVGAKVANAAVSLGMKVYGYDPCLSVDAAWMLSSKVIHAVDIETLYNASDYVTIHVPYTPATRHMINAEAIAKMKDGVRIINLARAELVNDDDLIAAIDAAKVSRYVTDFPNGKTAKIPNVLPVPHLGASTPGERREVRGNGRERDLRLPGKRQCEKQRQFSQRGHGAEREVQVMYLPQERSAHAQRVPGAHRQGEHQRRESAQYGARRIRLLNDRHDHPRRTGPGGPHRRRRRRHTRQALIIGRFGPPANG